MPMIPGAIAPIAPCLPPAAEAPAQGANAISNSLQHVHNAQALPDRAAEPAPQGLARGAWRPWETRASASRAIEAPAPAWRPWDAVAPACRPLDAPVPAWRPWDAPTGGATPALQVTTGIDARRERAIDELLGHVSPSLLLAKQWVAGSGRVWRGCLLDCARDSRVERAPYHFADTAARQLTERGRRMLDVWSAVFDLSQLGYGDTIPKQAFEAFARSRQVDPHLLAHSLGIARKRLPVGPLQFPNVHDDSERMASLRIMHAAAISDPSPVFLDHLHRVNPALEAALLWLRLTPAARLATSLAAFSDAHGVESRPQYYVHGQAHNTVLTDRGLTTFAGERAAFQWLRGGCREGDLQAISRSNRVGTKQVRWYATRAIDALQAGSASTPEWQ